MNILQYTYLASYLLVKAYKIYCKDMLLAQLVTFGMRSEECRAHLKTSLVFFFNTYVILFQIQHCNDGLIERFIIVI